MYKVAPAPSDSVLNTFIVAGITAISGCVVTPAFLIIYVETSDESTTFGYYVGLYLQLLVNAFGDLCSFRWFLFLWFGLIISPLFLIARVLIVIMAFTSLRSVPAGVYANIPWTQYIPHI